MPQELHLAVIYHMTPAKRDILRIDVCTTYTGEGKLTSNTSLQLEPYNVSVLIDLLLGVAKELLPPKGSNSL